MSKSTRQNSYFRILFALGRKRDNGLSFRHPLNAPYPVLDKCMPVIQIHGLPHLQFMGMAAEDVFNFVLPYKINYA